MSLGQAKWLLYLPYDKGGLKITTISKILDAGGPLKYNFIELIVN